MRIFIITLFILIASLITSGQNKLIIKNGNKRVCIKKGQLIGITLKGEEFKFSDWKNLCECNIDIRQNLWVIDGIEPDSLKLVGYDYKISFKHDTIYRKHLADIKTLDYIIDTIIPSGSGKSKFDQVVYRTPFFEILSEKHKIIKYDQIESFTFARNKIDDCFDGKNHEYYNYWPPGFAVNDEAAIIFGLIFFTVVATELTINLIAVKLKEVKTYNLKDWNTKIKIR